MQHLAITIVLLFVKQPSSCSWYDCIDCSPALDLFLSANSLEVGLHRLCTSCLTSTCLQGVLQHMSDVELIHWLRVAAARGGFAAAAQANQLLQKFSDKPQALQHKVEVGAEYVHYVLCTSAG